jgi:hypothetical protein
VAFNHVSQGVSYAGYGLVEQKTVPQFVVGSVLPAVALFYGAAMGRLRR